LHTLWGVDQVLRTGTALLVCREVSRSLALGNVSGFFSLLKIFVCFETLDNPVRLPLGPHKVVLIPVVVVSQLPPKSGFHRSPDQDRVVSSTDVVLVRREIGDRKRLRAIVGLVDLHQECSVVSFLQVEVFFFVLRVGQVLRKSLNLLA
jgi:hypothetical protein